MEDDLQFEMMDDDDSPMSATLPAHRPSNTESLPPEKSSQLPSSLGVASSLQSGCSGEAKGSHISLPGPFPHSSVHPAFASISTATHTLVSLPVFPHTPPDAIESDGVSTMSTVPHRPSPAHGLGERLEPLNKEGGPTFITSSSGNSLCYDPPASNSPPGATCESDPSISSCPSSSRRKNWLSRSSEGLQPPAISTAAHTRHLSLPSARTLLDKDKPSLNFAAGYVKLKSDNVGVVRSISGPITSTFLHVESNTPLAPSLTMSPLSSSSKASHSPTSPNSTLSKPSAIHPEPSSAKKLGPLISSQDQDACTTNGRKNNASQLEGGALPEWMPGDWGSQMDAQLGPEKDSDEALSAKSVSTSHEAPFQFTSPLLVEGEGSGSWVVKGLVIPGFDEEGVESQGESGDSRHSKVSSSRGEDVSGFNTSSSQEVSAEQDRLPKPSEVPSEGKEDQRTTTSGSTMATNSVSSPSVSLSAPLTSSKSDGSESGASLPSKGWAGRMFSMARNDEARRQAGDGASSSSVGSGTRERSLSGLPRMRERNNNPLVSVTKNRINQISISVSHKSLQVAKAATSVMSRAKGALVSAVKRARGEMSLKQLHLHKVLGQGAFGVVHLCTRRWHNKDVFALKSMDKRDLFKRNEIEHVLCEKHALLNLDHPFIVQLRKSFQDPMRVYFLLEFVSGGDLFSRLEERGRLSEASTRFYAAEVLIALKYMHDLNFVYRDLKPENVLIDRDGHVKLTDLGFARKLNANEKRYTFVGTPDYLAPEIVQNRGHDKAVDFWAFGVLLFELMAGYTPFYAPSVTEKYNKIVAGDIRWPTCFDTRTTVLLQALLHPDPKRRLGSGVGGAREVMMHAWFEGMDWDVATKRQLKPPYVPPPYKYSKPKAYIDRAELYRWHGGNGGLVGPRGGGGSGTEARPTSPLSQELQRHFETF